jgi:hypothetical protein
MLNNSNTITKDYILIIDGAILQEKKNQSEDWFFSFTANVVGAAGVEPATAWFVARYSIQLSYAPTVNLF